MSEPTPTIIVRQRYDLSRTTGAGAGAELNYLISGTQNEAAAETALLEVAPGSYNGYPQQSSRVRYLAPGKWDGTVTYNTQTPDAGGTFSFDTGGGSVHITHSKETKRTYGDSPPDCKGGIGVTRTSIDGCDVTIPVYNWSETHFFDDAQVTNTYKGKLFYLTGRTNDAAFKGFNAGEVLFLGASGSKRGGSRWEISFKFAASPNRTDLSIGDITDIEKAGWEYLWVFYEDEFQDASQRMVKVPKFVYIERVYDSGTFSNLAIGTT